VKINLLLLLLLLLLAFNLCDISHWHWPDDQDLESNTSVHGPYLAKDTHTHTYT